MIIDQHDDNYSFYNKMFPVIIIAHVIVKLYL